MIPIIVFDRSIFHGDKFFQLKSSKLLELVRRRRFRVFFTPMFVEETLLRALKKEEEFALHWDFLDSLLGQKWFKFSREIIAIELGDRIRGEKYYLQPKDRVRTAYRNARASVWKDLPADEVQAAIDEMSHNRIQDTEFRKVRVDLRGKPQVPLSQFFDYVNEHTKWIIENLFMKNEPNSSNFLDTWRKKRTSCRFTEQLLKASLATIFLAAADHQLKLGLNDISDSDQLAFLLWADIMVSDDRRYMKKAFHLLYSDSPKRLMTSVQFLEYMDATTAADSQKEDAHHDI
jgi:hypothetical protein